MTRKPSIVSPTCAPAAASVACCFALRWEIPLLVEATIKEITGAIINTISPTSQSLNSKNMALTAKPVSAETPVMLKYVASLFNPSYEFDMKTELKANIKKYFGYDLTDGDVENMCNALTKNGEVMVNAE